MANEVNNNNKINYIVVLGLLILVVVLIIFELKNNSIGIIPGNSILRLENKVDPIALKIDDKATAYVPSGGSNVFFLTTKDSVSSYDATGKRLWSDVHSMTNPLMMGDGSYVAVTESKSKQFSVYNLDGRIYQKTFDDQILTFTVNQEGYSAVILDKGSYYEPIIFDRTGKVIGGGELRSSSSFPLSITLSDDSLISSINYVDIDDFYINSRINFSYVYKDSGGDFTNGVFAEFLNQNENELIGTMRFISNNQLIYISDQEIGLVEPEDPNGEIHKWTIPLTNKIDKIAFSDSGFAIAVSDPLQNVSGLDEDTVIFYNYNGEKVNEYSINQPAQYITASKYGYIVGTGRTAYAFNEKGSYLWTHNNTVSITGMMFLNNNNTILSITQSQLAIMERVRSSLSSEPTPAPTSTLSSDTEDEEILTDEATEVPSEEMESQEVESEEVESEENNE